MLVEVAERDVKRESEREKEGRTGRYAQPLAGQERPWPLGRGILCGLKAFAEASDLFKELIPQFSGSRPE